MHKRSFKAYQSLPRPKSPCMKPPDWNSLFLWRHIYIYLHVRPTGLAAPCSVIIMTLLCDFCGNFNITGPNIQQYTHFLKLVYTEGPSSGLEHLTWGDVEHEDEEDLHFWVALMTLFSSSETPLCAVELFVSLNTNTTPFLSPFLPGRLTVWFTEADTESRKPQFHIASGSPLHTPPLV